jgi:hypothetical protein
MRGLSFSVVAALVVGLGAFAGCSKTVYHSHESHYCSSSDDDDPYWECSRSADLVCINTYDGVYPQPDGKPTKTVPMYLCRMACTPGDKTCQPDEVCCPGMIYGRNYGKTHGCTLPSFCAALAGQPKDAGTTRDTATTADAGSDAGGDAGDAADAGDAGSDVPLNMDATEG